MKILEIVQTLRLKPQEERQKKQIRDNNNTNKQKRKARTREKKSDPSCTAAILCLEVEREIGEANKTTGVSDALLSAPRVATGSRTRPQTILRGDPPSFLPESPPGPLLIKQWPPLCPGTKGRRKDG